MYSLKFFRGNQPPPAQAAVRQLLGAALASLALAVSSGWAAVLSPEVFRPQVERFNADDRESFVNTIPNRDAWQFLAENIPLFECPDKELELTYLFRWWTFRKHLRQTPEGWVITEFLPPVPWASKHNSINCAAGHHLRESRWLQDRSYTKDYLGFWFMKDPGIKPRNYSFWVADAAWQWCLTTGDFRPAQALLPELTANYAGWEQERFDPQTGLFWQVADKDGMEGPIGGHGFRPTINAYMYGDAIAIARIAESIGQTAVAEEYRRKAAALKKALQEKLWHAEHEFFEVREGIGSMGLLGWRINDDVALTRQARPSASVPADAKALASLNGGFEPKLSWNWSVPHLKFEDEPGKLRMGTAEWVQYDFPQTVTVSSTQVYVLGGHLFDVPQSVRLYYRTGGQWREIQDAQGAVGAKDRWNQISFSPVVTDGLRLELKLRGYDRARLALRNVRELLGYVPWCFNLPDAKYSVAWRQLTDPQGFAAPFGLTTAEQRHPDFKIRYDGHECLWNGPVWPFATSQTLTALANLLNDSEQDVVSKRTYFDALSTYARSHRLTLPDGRIVPWIDEDQNPYTGDWIARTCILNMEKNKPDIWKRKGGTSDRGKDYNHSTFGDLVISGLVGLRPQADDRVVVNPLVPDRTWEWFCLDRVPYHGRSLTILWDKTGKRYNRGQGLRVLCDGEEIASADTCRRVEGRLAKLKPQSP